VGAAGGLAAADQLELRLSVVVEAGALFFDYARPVPGHRGRNGLSSSQAVQYHVVVAEAGGPDAEPGAAVDPAERY
jgi:hypothetical protein